MITTNRRLAYITLDAINVNNLICMIRETRGLKTNLPKDVRVAWFAIGDSCSGLICGGPNRLNIILESEEFHVIYNGEMIPRFDFTLEEKKS